MRKSIITVFFVLIAGAGFSQPDLKKLDAYYEKALKDWDVPGMSIAIVKDGKIIFAKGYGVKQAGGSDKPDENTLFAIASNSKSFTSAAIAQLVDEGKLSWNDKVKKHLPYFELYDPWVSSEVTIRDLLSHRVGLRTFSGDLIWYRSALTAEEMIRRVRYLPKAYDFRSGYGYSNVMYITAGEVLKKITGKPWEEMIRERFFGPLGMDRSIATTRDLDKKGNYATPHLIRDGVHQPMAWEDWGHVAATGGILSSARDMSQWMIFNIDHGIWKNDTLISAQSRNLLWTPHTSFTIDHTNPGGTGHFNGYGLGWFLSDYRGKMVVSHTGGYSGMLSAMALVPEEKLGVVVLTNGLKGIYSALVNYTIDAFINAPPKDWSAEQLASSKKNKDTRIEDRKRSRAKGTSPSVSLDKYCGTYAVNTYGKISVSREGDTMKIRFEHTPDLAATLTHWHFDVWQLNWDRPEVLPWFTFGTVKFELNNNNEVTGISFDVPNDDFWFEELNAKKIN
jgi:CubicO group peptidase (beta-lactamase class C family)